MTEQSDQLNSAPDQQQSQALQSLIGMLRFLFMGLRVLIIVVFVCLLFGGIFYVEEYERAMLFRFGKLVTREGKPDTFGSGWYWGWPSPVDSVRKIPAGRSITITTDQFWSRGSAGALDAAQQPPGQMQETLRPGEDGYLVTGDANIMHMVWSCTYRISDPKRYYLGLYAPEDDTRRDTRGVREILRSVLANAVLKEVARWPVESVYRLGRRNESDTMSVTLDKAVWAHFEDEVETLDLGIDIQYVGASPITPPGATLSAFREVADAANEYQTAKDEAEAYHEQQLAQARGEESRILAEARAYRKRVVQAVTADADTFADFNREYRKAPRATLFAFYLDTLGETLDKVGGKYLLRPREDGRQEVRLRLSPKPEQPKIDATETETE